MTLKSAVLALAVATAISPSAALHASETSFFGLEIGKPVSLGDCTPQDFSPSEDSHICVARRKSDSSLLPWGQVDNLLHVPVKHWRPWGPKDMMISEFSGEVVQIFAQTHGHSYQDEALADLSNKYGKPQILRKTPLQNRTGAKFFGLYAEWKMSGFKIVLKGVDGSIDSGSITIRSDRARDMDAAADKWRSANKPGL